MPCAPAKRGVPEDDKMTYQSKLALAFSAFFLALFWACFIGVCITSCHQQVKTHVFPDIIATQPQLRK